MLSVTWSAALTGVDAHPVRVEVDVGPGLAGFTTVGLPDASVRESRERVISALRNSGFEFPLRRITVNLAPADVRKEGTGLDLPVALGILAASGQLSQERMHRFWYLGELSLDGALRPLRGALALAGVGADTSRPLVLPAASAPEAALHPGAVALGVERLVEVVALIRGELELKAAEAPRDFQPTPTGPDLSVVVGQPRARRALCVAAAGGHALLLTGPPGAGKTLLARTLPGILPALSESEALEVTRIHSVAGLLGESTGLLHARPFRAPHHTVSYAGMVGGGRPLQPGEISLAHGGVLFLDELAEFPPRLINLLRQPLEEGRVRLVRAGARIELPARFLMLGASNPCPCGFSGDPRRPCACSEPMVRRYQARIPGPIRDRFDLEITLPPVELKELARSGAADPGDASREARARVELARARQRERWRGLPYALNAWAPSEELFRRGEIDPPALELATRCASRRRLSARGFHRLLRVARTVADLEGSGAVREAHVAEAAGFRSEIETVEQ